MDTPNPPQRFRRPAALIAALAAVTVSLTACIAQTPDPAEREPTPTATAEESAAPAAPAVPAERTEGSAVYGPDGTHWATNTPTADAARVVTVAPTWDEISSAIVANATTSDDVVICVQPGTITGGSGAGSKADGVLQDVGNASRASRILVSACEGVGTVTTSSDKGIAFVGVKGVSIVGIDMSGQSVMIRNSEEFSIGYSEVPVLLVTANGGNGVRNVELVEIVAGTDALADASHDRVEVKSADGFGVDGLRFAGFYAAPHYKQSGSDGHTDTIQFVTTSGDGVISNVVIEDSAVFQSSSQGLIAGGNNGGEIRHSGFFGGSVGQLRYPVYAGGHDIELANVLHGTWTGLTVTDSVIAGSISSSYQFSRVADSTSTDGEGGFATLDDLTIEDLDAMAPTPTEERRALIWG